MKILIADDEPNIVTALEFLLQKSGYEVDVARNGDEVLERIGGSPPDLVLLDVMMPRRSGYEVCRAIRGRPGGGRIKILLLSAKGGEAEARKGLEAGADLYVTKPFSTRELVDKIKGLLAS
ncbi:MAG TPA: response regulator [Burkholderiales bacterium]|jgi:DNA-binding response OmpR family regulator|nr:response regulator [Burkholderiales bacterium]